MTIIFELIQPDKTLRVLEQIIWKYNDQKPFIPDVNDSVSIVGIEGAYKVIRRHTKFFGNTHIQVIILTLEQLT